LVSTSFLPSRSSVTHSSVPGHWSHRRGSTSFGNETATRLRTIRSSSNHGRIAHRDHCVGRRLVTTRDEPRRRNDRQEPSPRAGLARGPHTDLVVRSLPAVAKSQTSSRSPPDRFLGGCCSPTLASCWRGEIWLPNSSSNKNWFTAFLTDFGRAAREQRAPAATARPSERVREWWRMLDSGEVANRAELARRVGVSRARVTQVLRGN
jgi:hypothetical protein